MLIEQLRAIGPMVEGAAKHEAKKNTAANSLYGHRGNAREQQNC